jgi:hypothetical protein
LEKINQVDISETVDACSGKTCVCEPVYGAMAPRCGETEEIETGLHRAQFLWNCSKCGPERQQHRQQDLCLGHKEGADRVVRTK